MRRSACESSKRSQPTRCCCADWAGHAGSATCSEQLWHEGCCAPDQCLHSHFHVDHSPADISVCGPQGKKGALLLRCCPSGCHLLILMSPADLNVTCLHLCTSKCSAERHASAYDAVYGSPTLLLLTSPADLVLCAWIETAGWKQLFCQMLPYMCTQCVTTKHLFSEVT